MFEIGDIIYMMTTADLVIVTELMISVSLHRLASVEVVLGVYFLL